MIVGTGFVYFVALAETLLVIVQWEMLEVVDVEVRRWWKWGQERNSHFASDVNVEVACHPSSKDSWLYHWVMDDSPYWWVFVVVVKEVSSFAVEGFPYLDHQQGKFVELPSVGY